MAEGIIGRRLIVRMVQKSIFLSLVEMIAGTARMAVL